MTKISQDAGEAFIQRRKFKRDNTEVTVSNNGVARLYLHDNLIAERRRLEDGNVTRVTDAGWKTATTKERLNGIPGIRIYRKAGQWYLNDEPWNREWATVIYNGTWIQEPEPEPLDNLTGMMKAFMMMGDDPKKTVADRAAYKERIVFATMRAKIPGWEPPKNWSNLDPETRLQRLDEIQKM